MITESAAAQWDEEAARGQDEQSIAARAQARVERVRQGRSGDGPLPPGADRVTVATARVEAARQHLHEAQARKRERIAEVREQLRLAEARRGPKPNLGLFSFDETKGKEVSRARQRLARAEQTLTAAEAAAAEKDLPTKRGRGGSKEPHSVRRQVRRNVTDPDSRLMSAADGGAVQGYNAQLAGRGRRTGPGSGTGAGRQRPAPVPADEYGRGPSRPSGPPGSLRRTAELTQYSAAAFAEACRRHGIRRSMGRVGSSYDNALAESFFQGLKRELLHERRWVSKAQTRLELFRWLSYYNQRRRHSALGYLTPAEFEQQLTTSRTLTLVA